MCNIFILGHVYHKGGSGWVLKCHNKGHTYTRSDIEFLLLFKICMNFLKPVFVSCNSSAYLCVCVFVSSIRSAFCIKIT